MVLILLNLSTLLIRLFLSRRVRRQFTHSVILELLSGATPVQPIAEVSRWNTILRTTDRKGRLLEQSWSRAQLFASLLACVARRGRREHLLVINRLVGLSSFFEHLLEERLRRFNIVQVLLLRIHPALIVQACGRNLGPNRAAE